MRFASYNGVQETTLNSCGAFALAAALEHTGHANFVNILDTVNLANGFTHPGPQAFAQRIYQVTGCLNLAGPTATYQYQAPVTDRNPPSALAYMAVQLGVNPGNLLTQYNNVAALTFGGINVANPGGAANLLATEINLINAPAFGNVGLANYTVLPAAGEAHLLLVNGNTHWIAINNNQVYDPGTGYVGPYVVNAPLPLTSLTYTLMGIAHVFPFDGIWIQLS